MKAMGLKNVQAVYREAAKGRLLKRRDNGDWVLDSFALNVLTYMASKSFDYNYDGGHDVYYPNCYYDEGWHKIAESLGILSFDARRAQAYGEDLLYRKRENTAKSRISKAWRFLSDQGFLVKVKSAGMGDNAGFVLTLLDDAGNRELIEDAVEKMGLSKPDASAFAME